MRNQLNEGEVVPLYKRLAKTPEKKENEPTKVYHFRSTDTKRNMATKLRLRQLKANEETDMTISESVQNIVASAIQGEPKDVQSAIEAAINEKIAQALEQKKVVIANNLVGLAESDKDDEPSWSHSADKSARAKKLAMDKIKKQAKNEGVEFSDEEVEVILEEILDELSKKTLGNYIKGASDDLRTSGARRGIQKHDRIVHKDDSLDKAYGAQTQHQINKRTKYISKAVDRLTKEAIDYMAAWFTEEELLPLLDEALTKDGKKIIPSKPYTPRNESSSFPAFGSEHKGSGGTPSELSSAISKNKTSFNLGLKKKVTEASDPTNTVAVGFGDKNTKNKSPGASRKPGFSPNTYTTATPLGYDTGNKKPGDIMGKTNEASDVKEPKGLKPGAVKINVNRDVGYTVKDYKGNIEKQGVFKKEEVETINEMSPFAPKHAHRMGKKYAQQGGPKSDNPYPKSHILHTHWNQGHDEGAPKEKKNESFLDSQETINEFKKVSRSTLATKIKHGWHKGRGAFKSIADKAAAKYGSKEAGDRVAGAIMWHKYAHEDIEYTEEELDYLITECWNAINEKVQELKESMQDEFEIELTDEEVDLILEEILEESLDEASPPGWQHVVKKLLQKKQSGDFKGSPWAIAWSMKNKGYHKHKENQISRKDYDKWYQNTGKKIAGYA